MKQQLKEKRTRQGLNLVIAIAAISLVTQASVNALAYTSASLHSQANNRASTSSLSALEVFKEAYENRYTWDEQFPGYTAVVDFTQGQEKYQGRIQVKPDLSVVVSGINNESARQSIESQLQMLVVHRRSVPFEKVHKDSTFRFGNKDKNGAVEIIKANEPGSSFKVQERKIVQVNRQMRGQSFSVDTLDTEDTPEGYLATRYRTLFQQPQTKQVLAEEVSDDTYKKIGDYYLPVSQVIQHSEGGKQYKAEFNFSDLQLLSSRK